MLKQKEQSNCGEVAVRNIIHYFYKTRDSYFYSLKNDCSNFYLMKDSLYEYGIISNGYSFTSLKSLCKVKTPFICLINRDGEKHFIIVRKKVSNYFLVNDLNYGWRLISLHKFKEISENKILVFENYEEKKIKKISLVSNKYLLALNFVILMESLCLFYSFAIMNDSKYSLINSLSLIAVLLLAFMHKSLLISVSKQFDKSVSLKYFQAVNSTKDYVLLNNFKTKFITEINGKISSVYTLILALLVAFFSSIEMLAFLLVSFIIFIIYEYLFSKYLNKMEYKIYEREQMFLNSNQIDENSFNSSSQIASKYGLLIELKKTLVLISIFVCSIFYSYQSLNISYCIFLTLFINYVVSTCYSNFAYFSVNSSYFNEILKLDGIIYDIIQKG